MNEKKRESKPVTLLGIGTGNSARTKCPDCSAEIHTSRFNMFVECKCCGCLMQVEDVLQEEIPQIQWQEKEIPKETIRHKEVDLSTFDDEELEELIVKINRRKEEVVELMRERMGGVVERIMLEDGSMVCVAFDENGMLKGEYASFFAKETSPFLTSRAAVD